MLRSFRDKRTRRYYEGERVAAFQGFTAKQAGKCFDALEAATSLQDLRARPGHHFEALRGDRRGQYSIRINREWRICFRWIEGEPVGIEISKHYE